ncbi:substrate-binding periplasmic protein [Thalassomonas actiniarum]|uniref:Transporter substrate-binding domain-containing protein n=1 Tax=Thalassomonas actiniarum TaxID=485447 RepID=A0AAE9YJP7_9GAMM|nr:transporter substrate-binding domain-containing protein [Thalassomonas actiniarum]WDD97055.1 transporter substrate-binding domain-containing protein [Thalassomonas actiniarum]
MLKLFLLSLLMFLSQPVAAQENICHKVVLGGSNRWFPVAFVAKDTEHPQGIGYDLIRHIGDKMALKLEFKAWLPWKRGLKYLESGQLDMMSALYWNEPRGAIFQYPRPYFYNKSYIFVLNDKVFPYQHYADLKGLTGIYLSGSSFGEDFGRIIREKKLQLQELSDKKVMIRALFSGLTDYLIHDHADMFSYLKQRQLHTTSVALPTLLAALAVHFAFSRKSPVRCYYPKLTANSSGHRLTGL